MGNVGFATPTNSPRQDLEKDLRWAALGTYAPLKNGSSDQNLALAGRLGRIQEAFLDQLKNQFCNHGVVKAVVTKIGIQDKVDMYNHLNKHGICDQHFISMFLNRVFHRLDENSCSVGNLFALVCKERKVSIEDCVFLVGGGVAECVSIASGVVERYVGAVDESQLCEDVEKILTYS